ncbi:hypothetical protein H6P81_021230 [Aristolochia fimbriata]|uniref:Uncharacterized protein n=1 Tax=Aristolochia fimbriata TaxID=158543 RepID=A0AAV7DQJ6_ARIFI|nr:hypothetical protein H6P81_021230 [Aristolochia fimbriata]
MALFFAADPYPPPGNSQASMSRYAGGCRRKNLGRRSPGGAPPVQILVVVANIQMRTLKVKRGKTGEAREDSGITLNLEKGIGLKFLNRTRAVDGNARGVRDAGRGLGRVIFFCLTACPPSKRLSRRQGKSAKWIRESREKDWLWRAGHGVPAPTRRVVGGLLEAFPRRELVAASGRGRIGNAPLGPSPAPNSRLRTGTDKGNDRLIKTKHWRWSPRCSRNVISAPAQCQSEEIQPSAGKRAGVTMTLFKVAKCLAI